jgi:hypothetical protein
VAEFWVGAKGEFTMQQIEGLRSAGVAVDDLRKSSAGYGDQWETLRTFVRATATDKSEARAEIAQILGVDADALVAYSAEVWT